MSSFVTVFLIVLSGEHVKEQLGGLSVVCIITGGFEFILWKGAVEAESFDLSRAANACFARVVSDCCLYFELI